MTRLLLILALLVSSLYGTTVSGTIYNGDGTTATGDVVVSWPTFSYSGNLVMAGSRVIRLVNGALSINLYPLNYYTITYRLTMGVETKVAWIVPSSPSSVTILDVQNVIPPPSLPAVGITTLNGLTPATQTFATGTSGTNFAISSSGSVHTFNIPDASGTNRGLLTSADWTTFNSKLGTGTSFVGDVSGNYSATVVDKIKGVAVSSATATAGNVLVANGSAWVSVAVSGEASINGSGVVTVVATSSATNNSLVRRGSAAEVNFGAIGSTAVIVTPPSAGTALSLRRGSVGQTDPIAVFSDQSGVQLSAIAADGSFSGNASTSSALSGNPANCSAGTLPRGITAAGVGEGCSAVSLGSEVTGNLPVTNLDGGTSASSSTFWRGDGTWAVPPGAGGGEINTASNAGVGGVGLTLTKVGLDLPFKSINAGSSKLSVTNDAGNKEVDLDVVEANLALSSIGGTLGFSQIAAAALQGNGTKLATSGTITPSRCAEWDASGKLVAASTACNGAGTGDVVGPAGATTGNIPVYDNSTGKLLGTGHVPYSGQTVLSMLNTVAMRDSNGDLAANSQRAMATYSGSAFFGGAFSLTGGSISSPTVTILQNSGSSGNFVTFKNTTNTADIAYIRYDGYFSGNSATSDAFSSNPGNCSSGSLPRGVAAAGTAEGCAAVSLSTEVTGNLPVANLDGGTGANSTTFWRGDGTWATPTVGGGGNVSSGGSSSSGYFVRWANGAGTLVDAGLVGASTTATADSVVTRDSGKGTLIYDKGGWAYDVRAFGAVGDCSTDDRAAIQAAIDVAELTTSRTNKVYLGSACYAIGSTQTDGATGRIYGLKNGNGIALTSTTNGRESTTRMIEFIGNGLHFDGSRHIPTKVKFTASNPGSLAYLFWFKGPIYGGGVHGIMFDGNSRSNVRAVQMDHVAMGYFTHWGATKQAGGPAVVLQPVMRSVDTELATLGVTGPTTPYYACQSLFNSTQITDPASGGSGIYLADTNIHASSGTSCSNLWTLTYAAHDGTTASTYGLKLRAADNNTFDRSGWYSTNPGSGGTNYGCGIEFEQMTTTAAFPHENTFISASPHQGVCGNTGTATTPNTFIDYKLGDCYKNCTPSGWGGTGTPPAVTYTSSSQGQLYNYGLGTPTLTNSAADETLFNLKLSNTSGGQNGGGVIDWVRTGTTIGSLRENYFYGFQFYSRDGGGSLLLTHQNLPTGELDFTRPRTYSNLSGLSLSTNSIVFCSDCGNGGVAVGNCASGGSGAWAFKTNGTWRCMQ